MAVWNPKRKKTLLLMMAVALIYLISNNYFLIRFLSPINPNFLQIESALSQSIGPIRYALDFLAGTLFTFLNVWYLVAILRR